MATQSSDKLLQKNNSVRVLDIPANQSIMLSMEKIEKDRIVGTKEWHERLNREYKEMFEYWDREDRYRQLDEMTDMEWKRREQIF